MAFNSGLMWWCSIGWELSSKKGSLDRRRFLRGSALMQLWPIMAPFYGTESHDNVGLQAITSENGTACYPAQKMVNFAREFSAVEARAGLSHIRPHFWWLSGPSRPCNMPPFVKYKLAWMICSEWPGQCYPILISDRKLKERRGETKPILIAIGKGRSGITRLFNSLEVACFFAKRAPTKTFSILCRKSTSTSRHGRVVSQF